MLDLTMTLFSTERPSVSATHRRPRCFTPGMKLLIHVALWAVIVGCFAFSALFLGVLVDSVVLDFPGWLRFGLLASAIILSIVGFAAGKAELWLWSGWEKATALRVERE
jgi:hypothetical protein